MTRHTERPLPGPAARTHPTDADPHPAPQDPTPHPTTYALTTDEGEARP
ncbi:hypothetical protein [Streptomyces sp. NPDC046197]